MRRDNYGFIATWTEPDIGKAGWLENKLTLFYINNTYQYAKALNPLLLPRTIYDDITASSSNPSKGCSKMIESEASHERSPI
ncbi:hypothetical protein HNR44_003086 [Geomicrobium halophilum]|uniref:Uncharacterized protein n=1 Tax=Geomicrobium halophilum TaxID=549000 RepID=A0A841Q0K6_9BACL|nr:hypothetical protein [Geomicrobium halophilum]